LPCPAKVSTRPESCISQQLRFADVATASCSGTNFHQHGWGLVGIPVWASQLYVPAWTSLTSQSPCVLAPGRPPPDTLSRITRAWPTSLRIITDLRRRQYTLTCCLTKSLCFAQVIKHGVKKCGVIQPRRYGGL